MMITKINIIFASDKNLTLDPAILCTLNLIGTHQKYNSPTHQTNLPEIKDAQNQPSFFASKPSQSHRNRLQDAGENSSPKIERSLSLSLEEIHSPSNTNSPSKIDTPNTSAMRDTLDEHMSIFSSCVNRRAQFDKLHQGEDLHSKK